MKISAFIVFSLIFLFPLDAQSLKEETHLAINEEIATLDRFSFDAYLKYNLGFVKGIKQELRGIDATGATITKQPGWWLGYGGVQEDRPGSIKDYILFMPTRSFNHFHNPLKHWSEAGLNDILGFYTGQSSLLWAQNPNQDLGGQWSWYDARRYFYIALTGRDFDSFDIAKSRAAKEEYLTKTFRAVGQQMHLIHDASVPEHTRNDAHVRQAYEAAVEKIRANDATKHIWDSWIDTIIPFDKEILNMPTVSIAPIPTSRLIDSDRYNGQNPEVTLESKIGLAEYTNANFLSRDTMFTDGLPIDHRHYFPYPNAKRATLWVDATNNREYFKKIGDGVAVDHLAVKSLLHNYRMKYFSQENRSLITGLDEECYKEYASNLIPRAVGYSAGLLNYFFRGKIEITPPDQYVYSITDGSETPYTDDYGNEQQQFTKIKANLKNKTPNELMAGSGFALLNLRRFCDIVTSVWHVNQECIL